MKASRDLALPGDNGAGFDAVHVAPHDKGLDQDGTAPVVERDLRWRWNDCHRRRRWLIEWTVISESFTRLGLAGDPLAFSLTVLIRCIRPIFAVLG